DEQDIPVFEVGEQCGEVARLGDHRTRRGAEADPHLAGEDSCERGLAEPGRAVEQYVIERLAASFCRVDEHPQILPRGLLTDELGGLAAPYGPDDATRLSDRAWSEMVASGVTVLRDTILPVGNVADPWAEYQKNLAAEEQTLAANPDRLILVRSAADILKAKR